MSHSITQRPYNDHSGMKEIAMTNYLAPGQGRWHGWNIPDHLPIPKNLSMGDANPETTGHGESIRERMAAKLEAWQHRTIDAHSQTNRDMEAVFRQYLGATNVMWLGKGIAGDDTHGHVDDLCRFVGPRTIVLGREKDPRDANYAVLEENREPAPQIRDIPEGRLVARLEMPDHVGDAAPVEGDARCTARERFRSGFREDVGGGRNRVDIGRPVRVGMQRGPSPQHPGQHGDRDHSPDPAHAPHGRPRPPPPTPHQGAAPAHLKRV